MKIGVRISLFVCSIALNFLPQMAIAAESSFAVIFHPEQEEAGDSTWREALSVTDDHTLAFIVAQGIKSVSEPCTDSLYEQRKSLLNSTRNAVIVSLAASDWAQCKTAKDKSAAIGKLTRMRELFFTDEFSLGGSKLPLTRQSTIVKFRSYGENARWEFDNVMFATVNLPRNNNHYSAEAGRNSEFDDRQIANKDWLQRVFSYAMRKKIAGVVIFADGNPLASNNRPSGNRDGFLEMRKTITTLSAKFPGKVLLVPGRVNGAVQEAAIHWNKNLGTVESAESWVKIGINALEPELFDVSAPATVKPSPHNSSGR